MTDTQHGTWSPPGSPHPPGSTISICPLCRHEYEHPPFGAVPGAPGFRPDMSYQDTLAEAVRAASVAHARLVDADLFAHFHREHGIETVAEAVELLGRPVATELPAKPRTTDDYEIVVTRSPRYTSARGASPDVGILVCFGGGEIADSLIAHSANRADVLADLDLLIARLGEARRRVEELP